MANPPLDLDWAVLMPSRDDAPPPELEVVAGEPETVTEEERRQYSRLSDREIQDKLQRCTKMFTSGITVKLPDRGLKIRKQILYLQGLLDERKLVRFQKDEGKCEQEPVRRGNSLGLPDDVPSPSYIKSEPRSQPSFAQNFHRKLEGKAVDTAFKEELRGKGKDSKGNREKMHVKRNPSRKSSEPVRILSRILPFRCASNLHKIGSKRRLNGDSRVAKSPTFPCFHAGRSRSFADHSSKRSRVSENREELHLRSEKAQHVVFLDEEEAQPLQPTSGDASDEWKEAKIYYPSRDDQESIELSYSDIKCLDPESYLSSPIMNFYIRYLQSPIRRTRSECYFFNTYFYKKLEEAISSKGDESAKFLKLRRWWKGVNIFQKAYIFLPIHKRLHWSLVIICFPAKEDKSGPIVLHLDSLGFHTSKLIFDVVNSYLKREWNYINQNDPSTVPIQEKIWKNLPSTIETKELMVPQQKNEYDCGLFVLYFMERFMEGAPERLQMEDLSMFGRKWFKPEDASGLRERIRDLLIEEFENSRFENGRTESPAPSSSSPEIDRDQTGEA